MDTTFGYHAVHLHLPPDTVLLPCEPSSIPVRFTSMPGDLLIVAFLVMHKETLQVEYLEVQFQGASRGNSRIAACLDHPAVLRYRVSLGTMAEMTGVKGDSVASAHICDEARRAVLGSRGGSIVDIAFGEKADSVQRTILLGNKASEGGFLTNVASWIGLGSTAEDTIEPSAGILTCASVSSSVVLSVSVDGVVRFLSASGEPVVAHSLGQSIDRAFLRVQESCGDRGQFHAILWVGNASSNSTSSEDPERFQRHLFAGKSQPPRWCRGCWRCS